MELEQFNGILFDLDGTLVDTMPLHLASWELAASEFQFDYDADWLYALGGVPSRKIVTIINQHQGLALDPMAVVKLKNHHYQRWLPEARVFPAMLELLERHADRPMAIGTGSSRVNAQRVLQSTGLNKYFSVVISADDVVRHKPEPDTYLLAAERLGVAPGRCLVFEDTPIGQQAAMAAGMKCVMVVQGRPDLG